MLNRNVSTLLIVFCLLKLSYYLQAYFSPHPDYARLKIEYFGQHFLVNYANHDTGWYEHIVREGYPESDQLNTDQNPYAFFPLYPLSARIVQNILGTDILTSLFICTTLFSFGALLCFYAFVSAWTQNPRLALYSSLCLILFPHHFYFSMLYTESLFLVLLVASFYCLWKENTWGFMLASSLLVLTRINGIFMVLPLGLFALQIRPIWNASSWKTRDVVQFLPMLAAFAGYCLYLKIRTGNPFMFVQAAENGWGGSPTNPFLTLWRTLDGTPRRWFFIYNGIYSVVFLGLSLFLLAKRQYSFFALALICILIPLYEGSTISQPRFISIVFPFSILFGGWIYRLRARNVILILLLVAHWVTFGFWNVTSPFSY